MRISYGHRIEEEGDIYVTLSERAIASALNAGVFGTYLVDYIPLRECSLSSSGPLFHSSRSEVCSGLVAWGKVQEASEGMEEVGR